VKNGGKIGEFGGNERDIEGLNGSDLQTREKAKETLTSLVTFAVISEGHFP